MDVFLMQHGQAVPGEQYPERPLSNEGRAAATKLARYIAALGSGFIDLPLSAVWHSGKLRAEQTAEILARALAPKVTPTAHPGLNPNDAPAIIWEELTAVRDQPGAILLVGHLPHLGRLAALLLADDAEKTVVEFVNAGILKLRPTERGWTLAGYITPACVG
jgi:phosphohistidine phosphatase